MTRPIAWFRPSIPAAVGSNTATIRLASNQSQHLVSIIADPSELTGDGDVDDIDLMFFAEDFGRVEEIPQ